MNVFRVKEVKKVKEPGKEPEFEITLAFAEKVIKDAQENAYSFGVTSLSRELTPRIVQAIWDEHKEEIIASVDWKKITPTLERMALEQLALKAIDPNRRGF